MDLASKEFLKLYSLLLENGYPETNPAFGYWYAEWTNRRWPEAEEYIKKDCEYAFHYAKNIIKGRWPEAEQYIKRHPKSAYRYAKYIIKGRWQEAEETIKKNEEYWRHYLELICEECNGEGVTDLGIGGAEDECSRCNGGGFDLSKIDSIPFY